MLPVTTELGLLRIKQEYEYYDQPVLFSCINTAGQLFLAVYSVRTDEGIDEWLYLPMSAKRYKELKNGYIDTYSAFTQAEGGLVHKVIMSRDDLSDKVYTINSSELRDEWLPEKGEYLCY